MTKIDVVLQDDGLVHVHNAYAVKEQLKRAGCRWSKRTRTWVMGPTPAGLWQLWQEIGDRQDVEFSPVLAFTRERLKKAHEFRDHEDPPEAPGINKSAWRHQRQAVAFASHLPSVMLAHKMGCGKTLTSISILNTWDARRVVIVCPLSVMTTWAREFRDHSDEPWVVHVLDQGTSTKKAKSMQKQLELADVKKVRLAVVINYESIWRDQLAKAFKAQEWDAVVMDEIHRCKTPGSRVSKFMQGFVDGVKKRIGLTGTPMPHSPLDVYAQYRLLDPAIFGTSFARFRAQYAIMGGFGGYEVKGFRDQDKLAEKMALITHFADKPKDLPPELFSQRDTNLEPEAWKTYQELEDEMIAEVEAGEITVANGLVKLLRLQQITGGFLKLDSDDVIAISQAKYKLMADVMEDVEFPVVVFCRFRKDLEAVQQLAQSLGARYGEVSGSRKDLEEGRMPDNVDIMAVQIAAGGVGIDLTRASTALWYSTGFSLGDYQQACARLHRPGQKKTVNHIHLVCRDTVDEVVFKAIKKKGNIVQAVIDKMRGASV